MTSYTWLCCQQRNIITEQFNELTKSRIRQTIAVYEIQYVTTRRRQLGHSGYYHVGYILLTFKGISTATRKDIDEQRFTTQKY